ncbi:MAG: STN domain-containing protein [Pirellulales bacterium]|nr:STN domain-containing protein [Pirellulales bacterium]
MRSFSWAFAAVVVFAVYIAAESVCADEVHWLTGEPLRKALMQQAGVTWSNVPVRQSLTRFCRAQGLAFVLDRRIDPDRKVELSFDGVPLEEALKRIASRLDAAVAMVGPVVYLGPKPAAETIRTVAALRMQDAAKLPLAARAAWVQLRPLKWPDATTPRDLLVTLGREYNLDIRGLDRVPHDLWAAGDLPAISLSQRLTLVLAQFDLTFEIATDGQSISLVPTPTEALLEHVYNVAGSAQEVAIGLKQNSLLTSAEIKPIGNKLFVRARQEEHEMIQELLSGRAVKRTTVRETTEQVYTLRVILAVDKLLEALAKKLDFELKIDRDAIAAKGISLTQEVHVDVKNVSADKLLNTVLEPAGLTFTRRGKVVEVMPK